MNSNMIRFDGFQECLCPCALDECSFSIGKVNIQLSFMKG